MWVKWSQSKTEKRKVGKAINLGTDVYTQEAQHHMSAALAPCMGLAPADLAPSECTWTLPTQPGQTPPKQLRADPTQTQLPAGQITWQINASFPNTYILVPKPPNLGGSPSSRFGSMYIHFTNIYTKCNTPGSCTWKGFRDTKERIQVSQPGKDFFTGEHSLVAF